MASFLNRDRRLWPVLMDPRSSPIPASESLGATVRNEKGSFSRKRHALRLSDREIQAPGDPQLLCEVVAGFLLSGC